jgi:hypothetical protein
VRRARELIGPVVAIAACFAPLICVPAIGAQAADASHESMRVQAAALERQWRPRAADANAYFAKVLALLAKGNAPASSGEMRAASYGQKIAIANDALTKKVALVADTDHAPLYRAQTQIAVAMCRLPFSTITDRAVRADLEKDSQHTLATYIAALSNAAEAIPDRGTPLLNVAPPAGTPGGIPGMDPAAIKDPKLRAEYEASLRANARLAAAARERADIRDSIALINVACRKTATVTK